MQKLTDFQALRSPALIIFMIVMLFSIAGCIRGYSKKDRSLVITSATEGVLEYAEKTAEDDINYLSIKNVRSATKHKGGDISVCMDLVDFDDFKEPDSYTIVLARSLLAKDHADKNVHGSKYLLEATDFHYVRRFDWYPSSWKFYWYPIKKAQKGCDKISSKKYPTADSPLHIENINLPIVSYHDPASIEILRKLLKKQSRGDKIYALRWVSSELGTAIDANSHEPINDRADETVKIHLIYWPSQIRQEQEGINPIGIAGGYQITDKGSNWGYLLVPPAFAWDAFWAIMLVGAAGAH